MSSEDLYCENSSRERHPGSLVDFSIHDPRLVRLMSSRVTSEMVEYIARQTVNIVRFEGESPIFAASHYERFPLTEYIHHLVRHAKVGVPTLLSTLIYLERLRTRLPNFAKGQFISLCQIHILICFRNAPFAHEASSLSLHFGCCI